MFTCRDPDACLLGSACIIDCLVVYCDRVVALPRRVEDARPTALGDEVSHAVDMAVGPSLRGARLSPFPQAFC